MLRTRLTECRSDQTMDRLPSDTVELVRRAQRGEPEATSELFERYLPRVRVIVCARTGSTPVGLADVDDLAQEALLKAYAKLAGFEEQSEGSFRGWMARIVENVVIDQARHERAQKRGGVGASATASGEDPQPVRHVALDSLTECIYPSKRPRPSAVLAWKETDQKLAEVLSRLPEHQREVIVLTKICEMPRAEVAERLGLSQGAARVLLKRSLDRLRAESGVSWG